MAKDNSGFPHVGAIAVSHRPRLTITVYLTNGYMREYDLSRMGHEHMKEFSELVTGVGLVTIGNTNELIGRLYHGSVDGWERYGRGMH